MWNFLFYIGVIGALSVTFYPKIIDFIETEQVPQKAGEIVRSFNSTYKPEESTTIINSCNVMCVDGVKTIEVGGIVYRLGVVKNTWGDLDSVVCQQEKE